MRFFSMVSFTRSIKMALILPAVVMGSVIDGSVELPPRLPSQWLHRQPVAGVAVKVLGTSFGYTPPPGDTVPWPCLLTVMFTPATKFAVTDLFASMVTVVAGRIAMTTGPDHPVKYQDVPPVATRFRNLRHPHGSALRCTLEALSGSPVFGHGSILNAFRGSLMPAYSRLR